MDPEAQTKTHIIKMAKLRDRERILKAAGEKQLCTYKEAPIRLTYDFLTKLFQSRRDWHEIFK